MKNERGITLISLVTAVILMMILATITTYTAIESYSSMREQAFVSKMIALQEKVDVFCDQHTVNDINTMGIGYADAGTSEKAVLDEVIASSANLKSWFDIDNIVGNYRFFTTTAIAEKIGLENFDVGIWLNPSTRNVIAVEGVKVDKVMYYRQYDLTGGQSLQAPVINNNTMLECSVQTYDNKADIKLEKKYTKITCNLKNDTTVISSKVFTHTDTITVTESGKYQIVAIDNDRNTELEKRSVDFTVTIVNKPLLVEGMTPIDESGNSLTTEEDKKNWYNYDESVQKWANVKLKDGSVYVWIPRFAYKINTNKTIDVKFLSDFSNITTEGKALETGYKVSPAFQNGVASGFANGEWDNEILGFWIAKYEPTGNAENGVNALTDFPKSIKVAKKSWGSITPKNAFDLCRKMESDYRDRYFGTTVAKSSGTLIDGVFGSDTNNIDTHLMKNSEWGAVSYLTCSKYGRSGSPTKKSSYYANADLSKEYCSTGKNTTGVFGLVGGKCELVSAGPNINGYFNSTNVSTKYATVYTNSISASTIIGDGMKETLSWGHKQEAPTQLICRGVDYTQTSGIGLFAYQNKNYDASENTTFRPIIIVEY